MKAFTLVELLILIVLLALLGSLTFPVLKEVQAKGDRTVALGQMRQIGIALLAQYPADHEGKLPGPLWPGQMPMNDPTLSNNEGRLVRKLAEYIQIDESKGQLVPLFIPPAFERKMGRAFLTQARTFVVNMAVPDVNGVPVAPFGNLAAPVTSESRQPRNISQTTGGIWVLTDADQLHPRVASASWKVFTPPAITHPKSRLALRFNGSVTPIEISEL